jgi:hypothetical protein
MDKTKFTLGKFSFPLCNQLYVLMLIIIILSLINISNNAFKKTLGNVIG